VGAVIALLLLAPTSPAQDTYEIGPADVLRIVVLGQPEMTGEFAVDPEGLLTFPILGKIKASGMTPKELERKLTTLLADGYLKRPQVSVAVHEYRSQTVYVAGEVQRAGPYALKADRSLLALMSDVGTLTPNAGHEVVVIRPPKDTPEANPPPEAAGEGQPPPEVPGAETLRVSLRELQAGNPEKNLLLQAGDRVYVPRAAQIYISGHVARPGPYRYDEGMTVLQALTLAGGVTQRGSSGRVKIVRVVEGKKQEIKVKATDLVQPEDTILVPERFF
jgi:polysaccharide export outer membrane protein